jgi:hypothetical protein
MKLKTLALLSGLALLSAVPAQAAIVTTNDVTTNYISEGKLRWGRNGFEGVLFTPGNPSPGSGATQLDAPGAPAWSLTDFHKFEFDFTSSTGVSNLRVDFNRDNDFLDTEEAATSTSPTLIDQGFKYVVFFADGDGVNDKHVKVRNFTINGTNFGSFDTTNATPNLSQTFKKTSGIFEDILITGTISFTGGSAQENPRIKIKFADNITPPPAVPLPASGWMGLSLMGAIVAGKLLRKRSTKLA